MPDSLTEKDWRCTCCSADAEEVRGAVPPEEHPEHHDAGSGSIAGLREAGHPSWSESHLRARVEQSRKPMCYRRWRR